MLLLCPKLILPHLVEIKDAVLLLYSSLIITTPAPPKKAERIKKSTLHIDLSGSVPWG